MKNSHTEENYLKALFHLKNNEDFVNVKDLSHYLSVKMPSVNNMMKKFAEKEWVIYEVYKPIKITRKGLKEASLIVRKHRLTEMFLVEKMQFSWDNVHQIAEQLEHIHSPIFFDKMDELLNFPKFDPHGEPIPDKDGNIITGNFVKLMNCTIGDTLLLKAVTHSDDDFLQYLNQKKIKLDTEFTILDIEKFDASMKIQISNEIEVLSSKALDRILVQKKG